MKRSLFLLFISLSSLFLQDIEAAKITNKQVTHIKDRHWFNAKTATPTSRFNKSMTVSKVNKIATKTIKQGNMFVQKDGKKVYQHQFKKPIGKTTNGTKAYNLRVVTDPTGNYVITAFPV